MKRDIKKLLTKDNLFKYSLLLFGFTLPLWREINIISLWILSFFWLFIPYDEKLKNLKKNFSVLVLFIIFFLIYSISGLYNYPHTYDFKEMERTLPLVILPLIIFSIKKERLSLQIIESLGLGIFLAMIISWINVFVTIYNRPFPFFHEFKYFFQWIYTGGNLLKPLKYHPSYFAVLIVFFLSAFFFDKDFIKYRKYTVFFIMTSLLFLLFLIETNSRTALISFLIITFIFVLAHFNKTKIIFFMMGILLFLYLAMQFDYLNKKIFKLISGEERIYRWKYIFEVFLQKRHFLFGLGKFNAEQTFLEAYKNGNFENAYKYQYNAHNQFLEQLVRTGIIGLSVFLWIILYFIQKIKNNVISFSFIILISIFAMGESFLQRNQGVIIFAFLYSFLFYYYKKDAQQKT